MRSVVTSAEVHECAYNFYCYACEFCGKRIGDNGCNQVQLAIESAPLDAFSNIFSCDGHHNPNALVGDREK